MAIQTNIYDDKIYFGLTFRGETTLILEPKNWDSIENHMPRDPNMWGFMSNFLEDKYGLLFSFIKDKPIWSNIELTGGGQLLQYIYETIGLGPNETVYFEFGEMRSNTRYRINRWRIVFDDYECDRTVNGGVSVSIEKMPFQAKFRSRMNAPCTVNTYANMDGEPLTPITSWQLRLHSKTLLLTSSGVSVAAQLSDLYNSPAGVGNVLFLQPDQSNLIRNELPTVFTQPIGLINTTNNDPAVPAIDVYGDLLSQYNCQFSGFLSIENNFSFDFWFWHDDWELGVDVAGWAYFTEIKVQRIVGGVQTIVDTYTGSLVMIDSTNPGFSFPATPTDTAVLSPVTGPSRNNCNKCTLSIAQIISNITVQAGDNVYVHLVIGPTSSPMADAIILVVQAANYLQTKIEYSQLTTTPATTADGFRIFDVLNQQLENLTGSKNRLISDFFSPGGFGYKYLLANGYGIRNYGGIAYKFKKDLQSTINDLQAKFFIGMGIKMIDDEEYLVVEGVPNFLKNRTIAIYPDTFEWKTKHSGQYCFNQVELGFEKYEGLNIVQQDEYCTQGSYLVRFVKYNNNVLTKRSTMIGSGYLLEVQRRNQFLANPGQSLQNDNDIFIVATSEPNVFTNLTMDMSAGGVNSVDFFITSMALKRGDKFIFNIENVVIGQSYVKFNIVNDPGFGYYICIVDEVPNLSVLPHSDPTHWDSGLAGASANTGVEYTIVDQFSGYPQIGHDKYLVTPAISGSGVIKIDVLITPPSPNQIFAERNQPFEICQNVTDPSTIYNGRLSLKHIRANWRPLIGVGLYFLDPTSPDYINSQLVTTLVKMNSLFTTKYVASEPHKGNVGDKTLIEITNDFIPSFLSEGENLFTPVGATCKIKIGWNEMNELRHALCGETGDETKDFGGVVLQDDQSVYWFCHIMDIKYNLVSQIAALDVQLVYKVV